jgi:hypothetical protein
MKGTGDGTKGLYPILVPKDRIMKSRKAECGNPTDGESKLVLLKKGLFCPVFLMIAVLTANLVLLLVAISIISIKRGFQRRLDLQTANPSRLNSRSRRHGLLSTAMNGVPGMSGGVHMKQWLSTSQLLEYGLSASIGQKASVVTPGKSQLSLVSAETRPQSAVLFSTLPGRSDARRHLTL